MRAKYDAPRWADAQRDVEDFLHNSTINAHIAIRSMRPEHFACVYQHSRLDAASAKERWLVKAAVREDRARILTLLNIWMPAFSHRLLLAIAHGVDAAAVPPRRRNARTVCDAKTWRRWRPRAGFHALTIPSHPEKDIHAHH